MDPSQKADAATAPAAGSLISGIMTPWRSAGVFIAIFAGNGAQALLFDGLPPILHQIAEHFGGGRGGEFMAQLASTIPILGVMISGLFSGFVVERMGVRGALLIGLSVFALAGSAGYVLATGEQLMISRFILGLGVGLMTTACSSLLAMRYDGHGRSRMNGLLVGVGSATGFVWLILSGHAASAFGWRSPFLLHGVWAVLMIAPVLLVGVFRTPKAVTHSPLEGLKRLGPVAPIYAIACISFMSSSMFGVQLAFVLAHAGIVSPAEQSHVFSLVPVGVTVASLIFGGLEARLGWRRLAPVSYLLLIAALLIVAMAPGTQWLPVAALLDGTALGIMLPCLWMLAMQRAPHDALPRALGLMTTAIFLGATLNPLVLAPIRSLVGLRGQYGVIAAVVATGLAIALLRALQLSRRPDEEPA